MESKTQPQEPQGQAVVPPLMSMSEFAKLGGGKVAYIKVMTAEEAKEAVPGRRGHPDRHQPLRPACRRRHADCADRQPPVGAGPRHGRRAGDRQRALRRGRAIARSTSTIWQASRFSRRRPARKVRAFARRAFAAALACRTIVTATRRGGACDEFRKCWNDWRSARSSRTGWCGAMPATGSDSDRLARRRPHDGNVVPGLGGGVHRGEPRRLRQGREHPAFPRRQLGGPRGRSRHLADQDDHLAARQGARRARSTSSARGASTTSSRGARGAGASCCASPSTRRTAWTRSIRRRG